MRHVYRFGNNGRQPAPGADYRTEVIGGIELLSTRLQVTSKFPGTLCLTATKTGCTPSLSEHLTTVV
ncbi:hypothetical protein D3C85_1704510 [compost metagenome]